MQSSRQAKRQAGMFDESTKQGLIARQINEVAVKVSTKFKDRVRAAIGQLAFGM